MRARLLTLTLSLLLPSCASSDLAVTAAPILGGTTPDACAWPTVVSVRGPSIHCSGVLVRPDLVVYAGHCGDTITTAYFGPTMSTSTAVATARCAVHPLFAEGNLQHDVAACVLASPMDLPIVPIASACELERAARDHFHGVTVSAGLDADGGLGVKRAILSRVWGFTYSSGTIGANRQLWMEPLAAGEGICPGDSGGPDFAQLPDGTFRVIGVHSLGTGGCAADNWSSSPVPLSLEWLESEFGDVTPCRAADGTWSAGCEVPAAPDVASGAWGACTYGATTPLLDGCDVGIDAGAPSDVDASTTGDDAGASEVDAGPAADDAGTSTDASTSADASPIADASRSDAGLARTDAGHDGGQASAGCGCRVGRRRAGGFAQVLASALVLGLLVTRRRR